MTGNVADHPVPTQQRHLTRRSFLAGSTLAVAGGLALYSGELARHEISITTRPLAIDKLPSVFHDFRVVQISDIHFDEFTEPSFVHRVVEHVNSLNPDLVLLTGDFISFGPLPLKFAHHAMYHCADVLRGIACTQRLAVMGNHDAALGAPIIRTILAEVNIPLLVDQHVPIERNGDRLWLCGANDPVTSKPNLDLAIPARPDGPVVLMCHAPDFADNVVAHRRGPLVDFMLSGHTHGGQVRFPFVGALHLPEGGRKYVEGLFRFGRMQLYVNRGIGAVGLPFRLNCPPEITLYTLHSAEAT
jgi:predicted MPP superfamily phosphohydrolase